MGIKPLPRTAYKDRKIKNMELNIDFLAGATIFSTALALTLAVMVVLPLLAVVNRSKNTINIHIADNQVVSDRIVRVWIVVFNGGNYTVVEANTPVNLPQGDFVVVFTGLRVVGYIGSPDTGITGYICRIGLVENKPSPPYIKVEKGRVVEIADRK